jgi:hypothetical protein
MRLEDSINARETPDLQRAIRQNELVPEAAAIAVAALAGRGAAIPPPMNDQEMDARSRAAVRASTTRLLLVLGAVASWVLYGYITDLFATSDPERMRWSLLALAVAIWPSILYKRKR